MPHEAATLARVDTRTIYRWIETAQIHFTETEGQMLVCLGSLSDIARSALSEPPTIRTTLTHLHQLTDP
jgi:hypothetical protein